MLVLSIRVRAPNGRRGEILASLRSLIGPALAQETCVSCRTLQDANDPDSITFVQAWSTQGDLERYLTAQQYRVLLAVADLSKCEPEIRIDGLEPIAGGIEVLVQLGGAVPPGGE